MMKIPLRNFNNKKIPKNKKVYVEYNVTRKNP